MSQCKKPRGDRYIAAGENHRPRARRMDLRTLPRPFPVGFEVMPEDVALDVVAELSLHARPLFGNDHTLEVVAALAVVTRELTRKHAIAVVTGRLAAMGARLPDCWLSLFTFHREDARVEAG